MRGRSEEEDEIGSDSGPNPRKRHADDGEVDERRVRQRHEESEHTRESSEEPSSDSEPTPRKRHADDGEVDERRVRQRHEESLRSRLPSADERRKARSLEHRIRSVIETLELANKRQDDEQNDAFESDEEDLGDIHLDEPGDLVTKFLRERGRLRGEGGWWGDEKGQGSENSEDEDEDSTSGGSAKTSEPQEPEEGELVGDDAAFVAEIRRQLTVEECRLIVRDSFAYFERVYRYRRREKKDAREGEQPLFPESIPFTRMLHRAVIGLALPVILGQDAFDRFGQQMANEFDLITGYKAAILIMARGNGKTMGMIDIIPFMILFQRKVAKYEIFITTPGQTLVRGILDQIKEQIRVHVRSAKDVDFATERPTTDNSSTFEWTLTDGRSFIVQCVPCTENQVRGQHPDLLIVDEARKVTEEVMQDAIDPIITDADALVFYISTPAAAGEPFDRLVRQSLAELNDPNCANPVMYPLLLTLVCEEHQQCDVPSKCMCGMCYLQPWKPISTIRPAIDAKRKAGNISALECEVLGLPPTFEGACYNPVHITAFERTDPTSAPPSYESPIIWVSIDPTLNGEKSDFSILSFIRIDSKQTLTTGASFAVSIVVSSTEGKGRGKGVTGKGMTRPPSRPVWLFPECCSGRRWPARTRGVACERLWPAGSVVLGEGAPRYKCQPD